ncbi:MAG: NAD(+) kinase [Acidobacteria bacterium]|nr:NAD(+) kinase [Acidobacteriota bacterium]
MIKVVGILAKPGAAAGGDLVPRLLEWLRAHGVETVYDRETGGYLDGTSGMDRSEVAARADLIIVLGGDGTLLSAARSLDGRNVPVLPVNLGSLGFLTAVTVDEIQDQLAAVLAGQHRTARRRMLHCELRRAGRVEHEFYALNDVVITNTSLARMIDLNTYVDDHFVCRFKADGLIVATPTGSTAYSLSAGGPIMFPSVNALCITPICPHMLTNRPVIVPDTSVIAIESLSDDEGCYLTIDGQSGTALKPGDLVTCRLSERVLSLIRPPKMMFFDVLRQKLKWGER